MRKLQQNTEHLWLSTSLRGTLANFPLKKQLRRVTVPGIYPISHHRVTNPNKPGKLRIVFGAAAEFAGTSLKKNLLQGPDMTNSHVGVLLHFCQGRFGLAANVEAMFHQVQVRKKIKMPYAFCGGQITTLNLQMSMSWKNTYLVLRHLTVLQTLS